MESAGKQIFSIIKRFLPLRIYDKASNLPLSVDFLFYKPSVNHNFELMSSYINNRVL